MSVAEILEQAKTLSTQERKELVKLMVDSLEVGERPAGEPEEHWGQALVHLLNELGPIDMVHPEIEDATEWVKQIRQEQGQHRDLNWGEGE